MHLGQKIVPNWNIGYMAIYKANYNLYLIKSGCFRNYVNTRYEFSRKLHIAIQLINKIS